MFPISITRAKCFISTIALAALIGCTGKVEILSNPAHLVIKTITLTPASPSVLVARSTQFRAIANYADGTMADITSTAVWASNTLSVAPLPTQGLLTCQSAGTSQISASSEGISAIALLTCSNPQVVGVKLGATPLVIRSNAPFQYQLLAEYADGTTADVTSSATWVTDSVTANVNSGGLVNCNNPGTATISSTFSGMATQASFTCVLRSITPAPGFVESAATFDGPFASWVNVKTAFGAKGDGVTDDTIALQTALNSIAKSQAVLWIPHGTYVISSPLYLGGVSDPTILGEDPLTTTISWAGPQGGTMFTIDGCHGINIGRLTFDGRGASGTDLELTWTWGFGFYPTRNLIHDSRIINTGLGISTGWVGETTVERVHFDHNTQAGISLGSWNALNWNVIDSLFTDNAIGVTNAYGAGNFNVTNSVFVRSTTADMEISNTGSFSLRSNLSVDSKMFFLTGETGAEANIIIQGNTIYNPASSPIETGTPGSLMLLDNQFLGLNDSLNILFSFCYSPVNFVSVGNTYSVLNPFGGHIGIVTSVDEATSPDDSVLPWTVPTEVYIPPLSHRPVFDVISGNAGGGIAIQAAIDSAVKVGGIVHLPIGNYDVQKTLEIPSNAKIAILGDGRFSDIVANSVLQGPVLKSYATALQLGDFRFSSYSKSPSDALIELHVPDAPSTHVFCDECTFTWQNTSAFTWDGLDDASMEFRVMGATGDKGIWAGEVHGGAARQNGHQTLGTFGEFMASSGEYHVDLGGHLLNEDGFHDTGQGSMQFELTGDGSVTQQGGAIEAWGGPSMLLNNFKGRLSLIGVGAGGDSYVNIIGDAPSNVFIAGVVENPGVAAFLSSDPNATIIGISNSATPNNATPKPLPDIPTTPQNLEHVMSMARTQILVHRMPIAFDSTTVRMDRMVIDFNGVGMHVLNSTPNMPVGSYSITSVGGASLSQENCGSGTLTTAGIWTLQDGGDGFLGLSRTGTILSEDVVAQNEGYALTGISAMVSARDRWIFVQVGDGSVQIVNRATGDLLTQVPGGCAYASKDNGTANQHWLIAQAN